MVRLVAHDRSLWHTRDVIYWRITRASVIEKGAWGQRARLGSCEDKRRHSRKVPSRILLEEARRCLLPFFPTPRRHVSSFRPTPIPGCSWTFTSDLVEGKRWYETVSRAMA